MREMIRERRQSGSEGKSDLLGNLINGTSFGPKERANDKLSEDDLMGMYQVFQCFISSYSSSQRKHLWLPICRYAFRLPTVSALCLTAIRGHETTAHSLGFTLALLATHQDIQEKAFQQLRDIVPEGETPVRSGISCILDRHPDLL
jgi:hypothetical protein